MEIFRIEKDGVGPYMYGDIASNLDIETSTILDEMGREHSNEITHPIITDDVWGFNEGMICGFKSMQDLRKWFRGYLRDLKKLGFQVVTYKTDNFIIGESGKQLAFVP